MKASSPAARTGSTAPSWQRVERGVGEGGQEDSLEQLLRQPAAAAVAEQHGSGSRRAAAGQAGRGSRGPMTVAPCWVLSVAARRKRRSCSRRRRRPRTDTMGAPSGCSGVQRVPKAGHSHGLQQPAQHVAGDGTRRAPSRADGVQAEPALGVEVARTPGAARSPLAGMSPMPRHCAVDDLEDLAPSAAARAGCPRGARRARTGSPPRWRPSSSCRTPCGCPGGCRAARSR